MINLAAKTVAHHGTVGVYGVPPVSKDEFQQFQMDYRGTPGNWSLSFLNPDEPSTHDMVCGWVKHGLLPVKRFISHTMPLSEIHRAYEIIKGGDAIKIVLTM